ncbi:MAG TPA: DNA polymerase III subunit alpha, partial [Mycobacteriales bacterium]|nr:DNA polymerase III subunit alpha [Mycobacteriales bacterium]
SIGLLKMDFLGLSNLTIISDAIINVKANRGIDIDLSTLPLDDGPTYELLARGEALGVFQLDGGPMRSLLKLMAPTKFGDLAAVLALYRPGPMDVKAHIAYADRKNGRQPIIPIHPELEEPLEPILGETYHLVVYQEQVMAIAQQLAGYSLGKADLLRRAMGKKKKEIIDAEYEGFRDGMVANGYSAQATQALWDVLVPFSGYGFNKSHTAGYGLVAYWTAYLKANFPAEYMAALLTSNGDNKDKMAIYLGECRRMGITVLPPDVNESEANFTPRGNDVRFGLSAVRNVGDNVVASIVKTRTEKGKFTDFSDYLRKVEAMACNKKVVESLIKAGAFDSLGHARRGLAQVHMEAIEQCLSTKKHEAAGQFDLFSTGTPEEAGDSMFDVVVPTEEWDKRELLAFEREMLGLYVSDHPLFGLEHILAGAADVGIAALQTEQVADGTQVTIAGIFSGVNRRVTRAGAPWAQTTVEDLEGAIEVLFFPQTYADVGINIAEDAVVVVKGRIDRRDDTPKLIASELTLPDLSEGPRGPVVLSLQAARCTPPVVARLREVLSTHPGTTEVRLQLLNGSRTTVLRLDDGLRVQATTALMGDLKALLGPSCIAS